MKSKENIIAIVCFYLHGFLHEKIKKDFTHIELVFLKDTSKLYTVYAKFVLEFHRVGLLTFTRTRLH